MRFKKKSSHKNGRNFFFSRSILKATNRANWSPSTGLDTPLKDKVSQNSFYGGKSSVEIVFLGASLFFGQDTRAIHPLIFNKVAYLWSAAFFSRLFCWLDRVWSSGSLRWIYKEKDQDTFNILKIEIKKQDNHLKLVKTNLIFFLAHIGRIFTVVVAVIMWVSLRTESLVQLPTFVGLSMLAGCLKLAGFTHLDSWTWHQEHMIFFCSLDARTFLQWYC